MCFGNRKQKAVQIWNKNWAYNNKQVNILILLFWVTVTRMYVFWVTVTQNVYLLSDSHSKCIYFEWLSLKILTTLAKKTDLIFLKSLFLIFFWTAKLNFYWLIMVNIKMKKKNVKMIFSSKSAILTFLFTMARSIFLKDSPQ